MKRAARPRAIMNPFPLKNNNNNKREKRKKRRKKTSLTPVIIVGQLSTVIRPFAGLRTEENGSVGIFIEIVAS